MPEQVTEQKPKTYVWAKTERAGDIVTVDKVEGEFTVFTDGTKVYSSVLPEVMQEAKNEQDAFRMSQPFLTAGAEVEATQTEADQSTAPIATPSAKPATSEVNVMLEMLKKISAKNTITMPLELNIPSKQVYELFKDQMDITKADLNEQILALVMSQINNLQEQLKPQAEEFIKQYYNGKSRTTTNGGAVTSGNGTGTGSAPDITY
jgi:hypothetical protein